MNGKLYNTLLRRLALALTVLAVLAAPSFSATVNLVAEESVATMPDGVAIPMWGYFTDTGQPCGTATAWDVGPQIDIGPADTSLTVNLRNCLDTDATSLVITGQALPADGLGDVLPPTTTTDAQNRVRVTSFTQTAAANGGTITYNWTNLTEGTYLYHSGTHSALQRHMGLYGAVKVEAAAGQAYGNSYDQEQVILYSEIDPALHDPATAAKPLNYKPKYFLVNGQPYSSATLPLSAGSINQTTLLRTLNAGLKTHVPTLLGSYMQVIAEDGKPYPYPREEYSMLLTAGKTSDVLFTPSADGTYAFYDRALNLTTNGMTDGGLYSHLEVGSGTGPTATGDLYPFTEDTPLIVAAPGVLANDEPGTTVSTASPISSTGHGSLTLNSDGSFSYVPDPNFNGSDMFTYQATDGVEESNLVTVQLTGTPTNDAPSAATDSYQAYTGQTLVVAAPGVLGNDTDIDGDSLSAVLDTGTSGGALTLNGDGSFSYTPAGSNPDSFTYHANDGTADSGSVTVNITVVSAPNSAPVAEDDTATTPQLTPVTIHLVANDTDADGNLDPTTVTIVNDPNRGGTINNTGNGYVIYTPRRGFKGTDVFSYTVEDTDGLVSNEATVRVNVIR